MNQKLKTKTEIIQYRPAWKRPYDSFELWPKYLCPYITRVTEGFKVRQREIPDICKGKII